MKVTEHDRKNLIEAIIWQYKRTSKHVTKKEIMLLNQELNKMPLSKLCIKFNCVMGSLRHTCILDGLFN